MERLRQEFVRNVRPQSLNIEMNRILERYRKNVIPELQKEFGITNKMAIPSIKKVTINVGVGRIHKEDAVIKRMAEDIAMITGQKPVLRKAKKSIAGFKLREGVVVGISTTLRGLRMYDFIDRYVSIALPRSKDFRGINAKNVDKMGNLNVGVKESSIFPEIRYENVKDIFSFQITVTTSAKNREVGTALLKKIGFPVK